MPGAHVSRWLALAGAASIVMASTGCSNEDCRCAGPSGPHTFVLNGDSPMPGTLTVGDVGPGDTAYFSFMAWVSGVSVGGNYSLRGADMLREVTSDGWVSFTVTSEDDWIFANRGSFTLITEERFYIRRLEYRRNEDGWVDFRFVAVDQSRVDWTTPAIRPGEDDVLEVHARLTAMCFALIDGVSQRDPTFENNALCRDLLVQSP